MLDRCCNIPHPPCGQWYLPWSQGWSVCTTCHPYQRMSCQSLYVEAHRQQAQGYFGGSYRQIPEKEFTIEELGYYDGSGGKPAYVAVKGIVYDVSREATWGGGTHFGLYAGKELTGPFQGCHGIEGILSKLPRVGILKT